MSKELKERKVPRSYYTTASVGIVTNELDLLKDKKLGPLLARGVLLEFDPSKYEIHEQTKTWFLGEKLDQISKEIYDFIGQHIDEISQLDMRMYYTSRVMARRGQDWRAWLKELLLGWDSREVLAEKLMRDPSFETITKRIEEFKRRCGYGKSTFNNIITRRSLRELTNTPARSDAAPQPTEAAAAPRSSRGEPVPEPELEMEVPKPVIEEAPRPEPEPAPEIELRDPSTMTAEEIRTEQEKMYKRNLEASLNLEEDDRLKALADELNRRAEADADEVDSGVKAEPTGDEVSEATTEHPIEDTAEVFEEESAEDASVEPSAEDSAKEPRSREEGSHSSLRVPFS